MKFHLKIWRQKSLKERGYFEDFFLNEVSPESSFLEMLDQLNEKLVLENKDPIAFDHDCREGICGACGVMINGDPHGPKKGVTTCQVYMRDFSQGETIYIEPFQAKAFPVVKDLIVDRGAFDKIQQKGGYVSVNTGSAPEAHSLPVNKEKADEAFLSATCIGCGACVASCKNASASLFVAARVSHLSLLPQGQPERQKRVLEMTEEMQKAGFGACSHSGSCELACPKEISIKNIAKMHREWIQAQFKKK